MVTPGLILLALSALAEPPPPDAPSTAQPQPPTATATPGQPARGKKPKGRRPPSVKETEGSEAPGRFQADTVIKSLYHHDGQPLEVDPD